MVIIKWFMWQIVYFSDYLGTPIQALCDRVFWMLPFSSSKLFPLNDAHIEFRMLLTAVPRSVGTRATRVTVKTPSPSPLKDRLTVDFSSISFVMLIFARLMSMFPTRPSLWTFYVKTNLFLCSKTTYFKSIVWVESTPFTVTLIVRVPSTLLPNTLSLKGRCKWTINR